MKLESGDSNRWRIIHAGQKLSPYSDVNNLDKNLSGKSDEREVKICKNRFFTLHPSFLIFRKLSFRTAKHKLSPSQRPCFTASNMTFHTTKHNLWRSETLPFANLLFVNRAITDLFPCNHLSVNALQKPSKIAFFSTERSFRSRRCP